MSLLIEKNLRILPQVLQSLEQHNDPAILSHIRSVAQYYRSFLDGLSLCHIVYDRSEFDLTRVAALGVIQSLVEEFETSVELSYDGIVWVRMEDAGGKWRSRMFSDRATLLLASRIREVTVVSIQEVA